MCGCCHKTYFTRAINSYKTQFKIYFFKSAKKDQQKATKILVVFFYSKVIGGPFTPEHSPLKNMNVKIKFCVNKRIRHSHSKCKMKFHSGSGHNDKNYEVITSPYV